MKRKSRTSTSRRRRRQKNPETAQGNAIPGLGVEAWGEASENRKTAFLIFACLTARSDDRGRKRGHEHGRNQCGEQAERKCHCLILLAWSTFCIVRRLLYLAGKRLSGAVYSASLIISLPMNATSHDFVSSECQDRVNFVSTSAAGTFEAHVAGVKQRRPGHRGARLMTNPW